MKEYDRLDFKDRLAKVAADTPWPLVFVVLIAGWILGMMFPRAEVKGGVYSLVTDSRFGRIFLVDTGIGAVYELQSDSTWEYHPLRGHITKPTDDETTKPPEKGG